MTTPERRIAAIDSTLLDWFSCHARDLPWRRTRDPYAIWVSEIMLQQTQVKTVIPYYERWMRALPTIQSVAKARSAKLHKLWEGLGYYTRVRNMQNAAQQIVARHDGRFPEHFDDILALPGIGRYTAGAIASIAFDQPTPILDGNVIRVLTRIFGIGKNPREKQTNAQLWQLAAELVTHAKNAETAMPKGQSSLRCNTSESSRAARTFRERGQPCPRVPGSGKGSRGQGCPRSFGCGFAALRPSLPLREDNSCSQLNQSLMELGALLCAPRNPRCDVCPVQQLCVACRRGWQEKIPNLGRRTESTARSFIAFVVERNGKFLVRQRPAGIINAQLWEFPNAEVGAQSSRPQRVRNHGSLKNVRTPPTMEVLRPGRPRSGAFRRLGFKRTGAKPLCIIKHSITRYRITLEVYRASLANSHAHPAHQWLPLRQLHKLAFTSAHKKILTHIRSLR